MAVAGNSVRVVAAGVALAVLVSGCVTDREREIVPNAAILHAYLDDKPEELHRHFTVMLAQGQRNRILNDMRLGLATFAMGRFSLSESLLDDAINGIEAIYANTPEAEKARSIWVKESIKDFKGEPYERVMAYYYRGLLYLRAGDYENARASFKGGMLQDTLAAEEQYRADFALMPFLQGWAAHCSGNELLAAEDFKEFRDINKDTPLPKAEDNVLVLVETGTGPVKYSDGPRLKIRRSGSSETANISWAETPHAKTHAKAETIMLEDIYRQAATRGGRQFDSILEGKADYKNVADSVGDAALIGAAVAAEVAINSGPRYTRPNKKKERERQDEIQQGAAIAAGALVLVGVLSKLTAHAMEVEADTRYWDNLSDRVLGLTVSLPPEVTTLHADFLSPGGNHLRSSELPILRAGRCGIAWVRDGAVTPRNPRAPFSAPPDVMASPVVIPPRPPPPGPVITIPSTETAGTTKE
ncbi:conserved hypothetical protein [Candidatus Terasakiella magnetica]|nr:conserved hypothetical protein [Candidatus Terasakiella magnetica]